MRIPPFIAAALVLSLAPGAWARGQSTPSRPYIFLFTPPNVTSAREKRDAVWLLTGEAGYARRAFQPVGGEGVGQSLALQATLTRRLSLFVRSAVAISGGATRTSFEGEVRATMHPFGATRTYAMLGAGAVRGYDAVSGLRLRAGAGHAFHRSRVDGDVIFERPLASGRDPVDLVTTLGWMRDVGSHAHVGVEAVGQDLEGFWEAEEAEGGARLYAGPSGSVNMGSWRFGMTAGPIFRATQSSRTSGAQRPLSTSGGHLGLGLRAAVSYAW